MPPRKRGRVSQATSPLSVSQPKTPTSAASIDEPPEEEAIEDLWTDEEEIGLFKGLIRWKPTGIHKHFHMLSLHHFLLTNGYISAQAEHTRPPGIWRKLHTLYNLDALDERENSRQLEKIPIPPEFRNSDNDEDDGSDSTDDEDVYSVAENKIEIEEFDLVGEDFAQRKWQRRLATERQKRNDSPPLLPELNFAEEAPVAFTPSFSIEPSDAHTLSSRKRRQRAGTTTTTKGKSTAASTAKRRSMRQVEAVPNDGDQEDEGEAEESEEEDDDDDGSTGRSTRNTRSARTRGDDKAQPRTRARGK